MFRPKSAAASPLRWLLVGVVVLGALAILRFMGGIGSHWFPRSHGLPQGAPEAPVLPGAPPAHAPPAHAPPLRAPREPIVQAAGFTQLFLNASQTAGPYPLDFSCFDASGAPLTCSPSFCASNSVVLAAVSTPSCVIPLTPASYNYVSKVAGIASRTCAQSSDARCTSAALAATFSPFPSVFAAYCNDEYLIVLSNKTAGKEYNLDSVPLPPGGDDNTCRTRSASLGAVWGQDHVLLTPQVLPNSSLANNDGFYKGIPNSGTGPLRTASGVTYWLPAGGRIGITLSGHDIFPIFNNRALFTNENCEVDACNEHIGQGGGQPHLHGDPFGVGSQCMYSAANYVNSNGALDRTVHPPLIGYADDGLKIFGRYLSTSAPGYSVALDVCGGHSHDSYSWHYHTAVLSAFSTGSGSGTSTVGLPYPQTTVGPLYCFRGNVSADVFYGQFGGPVSQICTGSSNYYVAPGYNLPQVASLSASVSSSASLSPSQSRIVAATASSSGSSTSSPSASCSSSAASSSASSSLSASQSSSPSASFAPPSSSGSVSPSSSPAQSSSSSASAASGSVSGSASFSLSVTRSPSASASSAPASGTLTSSSSASLSSTVAPASSSSSPSASSSSSVGASRSLSASASAASASCSTTLSASTSSTTSFSPSPASLSASLSGSLSSSFSASESASFSPSAASLSKSASSSISESLPASATATAACSVSSSASASPSRSLSGSPSIAASPSASSSSSSSSVSTPSASPSRNAEGSGSASPSSSPSRTASRSPSFSSSRSRSASTLLSRTRSPSPTPSKSGKTAVAAFAVRARPGIALSASGGRRLQTTAPLFAVGQAFRSAIAAAANVPLVDVIVTGFSTSDATSGNGELAVTSDDAMNGASRRLAKDAGGAGAALRRLAGLSGTTTIAFQVVTRSASGAMTIASLAGSTTALASATTAYAAAAGVAAADVSTAIGAVSIDGAATGAEASPISAIASSGLSGGAVAGIVIGALAALTLIAAAVYFLGLFRKGTTPITSNAAASAAPSPAADAPPCAEPLGSRAGVSRIVAISEPPSSPGRHGQRSLRSLSASSPHAPAGFGLSSAARAFQTRTTVAAV